MEPDFTPLGIVQQVSFGLDRGFVLGHRSDFIHGPAGLQVYPGRGAFTRPYNLGSGNHHINFGQFGKPGIGGMSIKDPLVGLCGDPLAAAGVPGLFAAPQHANISSLL